MFLCISLYPHPSLKKSQNLGQDLLLEVEMSSLFWTSLEDQSATVRGNFYKHIWPNNHVEIMYWVKISYLSYICYCHSSVQVMYVKYLIYKELVCSIGSIRLHILAKSLTATQVTCKLVHWALSSLHKPHFNKLSEILNKLMFVVSSYKK